MIDAEPALNPLVMIKPHRTVMGISAILLPFTDDGAIDWESFCGHVARTAEAGLVPAVNMDTGYVNLLDADTREAVLARTRETLSGSEFVAGAFVPSTPGNSWDSAAYKKQINLIQQYGGTPVIFQSYGLTAQSP